MIDNNMYAVTYAIYAEDAPIERHIALIRVIKPLLRVEKACFDIYLKTLLCRKFSLDEKAVEIIGFNFVGPA